MAHKGHTDCIWDTPLQVDDTAAPAVPDNKGQEINTNIFNANILEEDNARVCAEGFKEDDSNKSLPKNSSFPDFRAVKVNVDCLYEG